MHRIPKIFLLDDDPTFCLLMSRWANRHGVPCSSFSNVSELLQVKNFDFDLGVIDLNLHHSDGVDAIRELEHKRGYFPTILISNAPKPQLRETPTELYAFVKKQEGIPQIINKALSVFRTTQMYGAQNE